VQFNLGAPDMATVREVHSRLEPLIFFFIDGASSIDNEDEKWHLYALLVKSPTGQASLVCFSALPDPLQ
jgi:hypothetical protein